MHDQEESIIVFSDDTPTLVKSGFLHRILRWFTPKKKYSTGGDLEAQKSLIKNSSSSDIIDPEQKKRERDDEKFKQRNNKKNWLWALGISSIVGISFGLVNGASLTIVLSHFAVLAALGQPFVIVCIVAGAVINALIHIKPVKVTIENVKEGWLKELSDRQKKLMTGAAILSVGAGLTTACTIGMAFYLIAGGASLSGGALAMTLIGATFFSLFTGVAASCLMFNNLRDLVKKNPSYVKFKSNLKEYFQSRHIFYKSIITSDAPCSDPLVNISEKSLAVEFNDIQRKQDLNEPQWRFYLRSFLAAILIGGGLVAAVVATTLTILAWGQDVNTVFMSVFNTSTVLATALTAVLVYSLTFAARIPFALRNVAKFLTNISVGLEIILSALISATHHPHQAYNDFSIYFQNKVLTSVKEECATPIKTLFFISKMLLATITLGLIFLNALGNGAQAERKGAFLETAGIDPTASKIIAVSTASGLSAAVASNTAKALIEEGDNKLSPSITQSEKHHNKKNEAISSAFIDLNTGNMSVLKIEGEREKGVEKSQEEIQSPQEIRHIPVQIVSGEDEPLESSPKFQSLSTPLLPTNVSTDSLYSSLTASPPASPPASPIDMTSSMNSQFSLLSTPSRNSTPSTFSAEQLPLVNNQGIDLSNKENNSTADKGSLLSRKK